MRFIFKPGRISVFIGLIIVCSTILESCNIKSEKNASSVNAFDYEAYVADIESWQERRIAGLKKNWLSLAGLFLLEEGENTFGADPGCDIVFPNPNTPELIGKFILNNGKVSMKINPGIEVYNEEEQVQELEMVNDNAGDPTVLQLGTLTWYIIKRVDNIYVRLRDSDNPAIEQLTSIEMYPLDTLWRLSAYYEPHMTPKIIETTTTHGDPSRITSSGAVGFRINGDYYRLDVWALGDSDRFQTIFADGTSGITTYGAGRFVIVEQSDIGNGYIIDFNKAYNPPCAFTEFATCPLPPPQNRLPIRVTAGEKFSGSH